MRALSAFLLCLLAPAAAAAPAAPPTVALARAGRAALPITLVVGKCSDQELARTPAQWREVIQTDLYQMAYFAEKIDTRAKQEELDRARAMLAADDLRRCLRKMAGAEFDVKTVERFPSKPGPGVFIGTAADFGWAQVPKGMAEEECLLRTTRSRQVLIVGGGKAGMRHGVYAFLEKLGCRWFFPGETWEVVPRRAEVAVALDERQRPSFSVQRKFSMGFGMHSKRIQEDVEDWQRRNRMGGPGRAETSEGWPDISPDKDFAAHPEWFGMVNGQRVPKKPCYSNPEVIARGISKALRTFEKNPAATMVSVNPPDGLGFCECPLCLKAAGIKEIERGPLGVPFGRQADGTLVAVPSETCFRYANLVAEAVAKQFPGKMVGTLAYSAHSHPPSFDLLPNVYVEITGGYRRTPLTMEEQLAAFAKRAKNLGLYEYYDVEQWSWDKPATARAARLDYLASTIPYYYSRNVRAIHGEMSNNWAPNGLGYYLIARMLWNVHTDARAAEKEFYGKAFGAAAEPMKRLYRRWEIGCPFDSQDVMALSYRDLAEALRLTAGDSECRARVEQMCLYLHFLKMHLQPGPADQVRKQLAAQGIEGEAAAKRVGELAEFTRSLMDTHLLHSYAFLQMLEPAGKALGCDTKEWRQPGPIPTAAETRRLFEADLKGLDVAGARDISTRLFDDHDLVSLKAARPRLVPVAAGPIDCGETRGGILYLAAGKGEKVTVRFAGRQSDRQVAYTVAWVPPAVARRGWEELASQEVKKGTTGTAAPDLSFQAGEAGLYRLSFSSGGGYESTGRLVEINCPAAIRGGTASGRLSPVSSATYYFFVPRGTRRFLLMASARGGPALVVKDARGNKALETTRDPKDQEGRTRSFIIEVPTGSDGAVWSVKGPDDPLSWGSISLAGVPNWLSFRPDQLLVPRDALQ